MAGVSTPRLAAAVSNAGGLGSIGVGASAPEAARNSIEEVKKLTDRPFNVNVFVHEREENDESKGRAWIEALRPTFSRFGADPPTHLREIYNSFADDKEMLQVLLDTEPAVVSFHFGLPAAKVIDALKSRGIVLFASVTSLAEAQAVEQTAVDVVVAQGYEAGGHRGIFDPTGPDDQLSTTVLTRLLVSRCSKPVIAAGGIMDGAGINSVLALGAIAAQLGTAFVCCDESSADAAYRQAMLPSDTAAAAAAAAAQHTVMTSAISGRPARCLSNAFTALGQTLTSSSRDNADVPVTPGYPYTYDIGKALHAAAKAKGENGFGAQWAGQGAPLARKMPAAELMKKLEEEMGSQM
ncbi:hypothetical protein I316_04613 [Kwoniella heveanensis BCC8398]|uniref:Uncharacterized protein n=1 Tax=Kwoniella heveanensis BCC8398 TaxID=1296120 RepID=A0A1B9GR85_9TREE|nr:hypothetical protein I316_04613 [Kwoniella heveanensis BCC8398]